MKKFEDRLEDAAGDMGFDTSEDLTSQLADHGLVVVDKNQLKLKDDEIASLRYQLRLVDNHTAEWFKERLVFAFGMINQIREILEFHDSQEISYWALTLHKIRDVVASKLDLDITRDLEEERFLEACTSSGISSSTAEQAWENWSGRIARRAVNACDRACPYGGMGPDCVAGEKK
jgi:hypothetical protein